MWGIDVVDCAYCDQVAVLAATKMLPQAIFLLLLLAKPPRSLLLGCLGLAYLLLSIGTESLTPSLIAVI